MAAGTTAQYLQKAKEDLQQRGSNPDGVSFLKVFGLRLSEDSEDVIHALLDGVFQLIVVMGKGSCGRSTFIGTLTGHTQAIIAAGPTLNVCIEILAVNVTPKLMVYQIIDGQLKACFPDVDSMNNVINGFQECPQGSCWIVNLDSDSASEQERVIGKWRQNVSPWPNLCIVVIRQAPAMDQNAVQLLRSDFAVAPARGLVHGILRSLQIPNVAAPPPAGLPANPNMFTGGLAIVDMPACLTQNSALAPLTETASIREATNQDVLRLLGANIALLYCYENTAHSIDFGTLRNVDLSKVLFVKMKHDRAVLRHEELADADSLLTWKNEFLEVFRHEFPNSDMIPAWVAVSSHEEIAHNAGVQLPPGSIGFANLVVAMQPLLNQSHQLRNLSYAASLVEVDSDNQIYVPDTTIQTPVRPPSPYDFPP